MEPLYLGAQVQYFRVLRGMYQEDLAQAADLVKSTISKIETIGEYNTDIHRIRRIAHALRVPLASLFTPPSLVVRSTNTDLLIPLFRSVYALPSHVLHALLVMAEAVQEAQPPPAMAVPPAGVSRR